MTLENLPDIETHDPYPSHEEGLGVNRLCHEIFSGDIITFLKRLKRRVYIWSSDKTLCADAFAWASIDVPACTKIWDRVNSEIS